jgi:DNA polymerase-3 subunit gamma/tau
MRAQLGRGLELARLAFERIMFGARAPRKTGIDAFGMRDGPSLGATARCVPRCGSFEEVCDNDVVTALYRTYRSLDFSQVVGQEAVVRTLRNAIEHDQVRQAYLFAGPRGTGKTSMARILAKALNAEGGPSADFDPTTRIARAIADGTALDVVEMDAASQRGIDEVREIRERAMLQPAEGRYKVYIVDEAHQLTTAAWNALLKLIEEPPPHLVFVFCTTELSKVIATVRSRCQTFVFQRPRLQEIVTVLRRVCDGEAIDAPDSALSLIARGAGGSFRDAISTLDQLAAATGNHISVQDVLQLGTAVEEDVLFRLCDTIVDRDVAGALVLVEELSERGQDLGQLTRELLEHLRQLLLVQHLGHVPESLPLTDESRDRLREQANQLPEPTVLRLIDLLAVVVDDERQGGDPRLPLELALVKVTRPQSDLARESLVHRVEVLESRVHAGAPAAESWGPSPVPAPAAGPAPLEASPPAPAGGDQHAITLEQVHEAWTRSVLPAVQERSIPAATLLGEATPTRLENDTITLSFPSTADFHRKQADEPKNLTVLRDALYEVTGRKLAVVTELSDEDADGGSEAEPAGEESLISLLVNDLNATEVEETS